MFGGGLIIHPKEQMKITLNGISNCILNRMHNIERINNYKAGTYCARLWNVWIDPKVYQWFFARKIK